jgi:hypothetical protein
MQDIVLQCTYPRLDAEVSKHRNHLLKAPFCVHPKTGRVCVPVDPEKIEDFDPDAVPTVGQVLRELDAIPKSDDGFCEHHLGELAFSGLNICYNNSRLGKDLFKTLYRHVEPTCANIDGGNKKVKAREFWFVYKI